jgi:hypothetical protein
MISADEKYPKHRVTIAGLKMAYVEEGVGVVLTDVVYSVS